MNEYVPSFDTDQRSIIVDRLIAKGRDVLDLCLERGKGLGMKGFIDCQIEQGGIHLHVVEGIIANLELRLTVTRRGSEHALLADLLRYAEEQLRQAGVSAAEPLEAF